MNENNTRKNKILIIIITILLISISLFILFFGDIINLTSEKASSIYNYIFFNKWIVIILIMNILILIYLILFRYYNKNKKGKQGIKGKQGDKGDRGENNFEQICLNLNKLNKGKKKINLKFNNSDENNIVYETEIK